MDKRNSTTLQKFLKISLDVLIVLGIVVFLWAAVKSLVTSKEAFGLQIIFTYALFITGGLSLLGMLFYLRGIVDSLIKRTPFIWDNVKSLKRISIFSFIISLCYVLNIVVNNQLRDLNLVSIDKKGIHTDIEFLIFFFAGCFIFILSEVFKQAVEFKEENDLTV